MRKSEIFKNIRNRLVSVLDVEVNPQFNPKIQAKKSQVVIESPTVDESEPTYNDVFDGESVVNIVISAYGLTHKDMDNIVDDVKEELRKNDISGLELQEITDAININTVNENKYFTSDITFTYLVV